MGPCGTALVSRRCRAMTSQLACVVIDATDPTALAGFWKEVLGWVVVEEDDTGVSLAAPGTRMPALDILRVPEVKAGKNRPHLDNGTRRPLDDRTRRSGSDGTKTTMPISAAEASQEAQDRSGPPVEQDSLLLSVQERWDCPATPASERARPGRYRGTGRSRLAAARTPLSHRVPGHGHRPRRPLAGDREEERDLAHRPPAASATGGDARRDPERSWSANHRSIDAGVRMRSRTR